MSKQIIMAEIRHIIESLKEQQDQIASHDAAVPRIELDIMMGNVRKLYEAIYQLSKSEKPQAEMASPPQVVTVVPKAVQAEPEVPAVPVAVQTPTPVKETQIEKKPEPEVVSFETEKLHQQPEELLASIETAIAEPVAQIHHEEELPRAAVAATVVARKKSPSPTASLFDEPESLADTIEAKPTVYDTIASQAEDKSIGKKMQSEPVTDLKKSIGINEKFAFINELFDGDLDSYNRAIEQLNSCNDIAAALNLLEDTMAKQYSWSDQGTAFLNLKKLVERRYA